MTLGFGERSQKMILRFNYENGPGFTAASDPRDLNASVRYDKIRQQLGVGMTREERVEGRVMLEARNGEA